MAQEQAEARNLFIINYLEQMEKLDQCLTWFSLRDNVMSRILAKYFLSENIDNNSRILLNRYNICKNILLNPELVYDEVTTNELYQNCPSDDWRVILELEFEQYDPLDPLNNTLDLLNELKRITFASFKECEGFARFRRDVMNRNDNVIALMSQTFDEINNVRN